MSTALLPQDRFSRILITLLVALILIRLSLLNAYPLLGTTEPRYAELARKMLESGDWVTLWVSDGVPLWGKPPLLFWLDAISMSIFGVNEFAVRLPSFFASLGVMWLIWLWPNQSTPSRLIACLVYLSSPLGFLAAGFVATDIFLTLGLLLSMIGFWQAIANAPSEPLLPRKHYSIWAWLFFVGIAIGLLAKGPLSIVLLGIAIFLWLLLAPTRHWHMLWQCLPWWRGSLLTAILALPWYIWAEIRTPGFLYHFVVGEHILRFLVKDWAGGRFAPSHGEPLGMIWWFAIQSFLPWLLLLVPCFYLFRKKLKHSLISAESCYLLCWIFSPLLLFTLSHNILEAYVLPALPAFAILIAQALQSLIAQHLRWQWSMTLIIPIPLTVVVSVIFFYPVLATQSQKHLLQNWSSGTPLYYVGGVPPSAVFYSANQAKMLGNTSEMDNLKPLKPGALPAYVVMLETDYADLSAEQKSRWQKIETYREYIMLRQLRP